jgi:hypothetical protein
MIFHFCDHIRGEPLDVGIIFDVERMHLYDIDESGELIDCLGGGDTRADEPAIVSL